MSIDADGHVYAAPMVVNVDPYFKAWEHVLKFDTSKPPKVGDPYPCLRCVKLFVTPMYVGAFDGLCQDCRKLYGECATIICKRCRMAVCKVTPKLLDNGYYIAKRAVLHIPCCGVCKRMKEHDYTEIEEITTWQRQRGQTSIRTIFLPGAKP